MGIVRVVTDSTADFDGDEAERLGVTMVPLNVHWSGETYRDKIDLGTDDFYRKLREDKTTPTTSQPSAGQFEAVYDRLLGEADGVISIHISGKLSGTVNSARVAAKNVDAGRITVIDSLSTTYPLGSVALRLASLAESGGSLQQCAEEARSLIPRLRLVVGVDTLEYLRRGGRIGRAQAFAAGLLAIKLLFQVANGEVEPLDRVRTRKASIKRLAEVVRRLGAADELAVLYGDDPEPAEKLAAILSETHLVHTVRAGRIGPVLGTHTGPGVFGVGAVLSEK